MEVAGIYGIDFFVLVNSSVPPPKTNTPKAPEAQVIEGSALLSCFVYLVNQIKDGFGKDNENQSSEAKETNHKNTRHSNDPHSLNICSQFNSKFELLVKVNFHLTKRLG